MATEQATRASHKARVLVVEDDRSSRAALMALLRMVGFDPMPAATVAEGLSQLQFNPECIILDLMLPDGNGSTLLAHVREHKMPICVAVTTGAVDWQGMISHSSAPPDAVFSKPLDFKQLTRWLAANCSPGGKPPVQ